MTFLPGLRQSLLQNGEIYTVRKYFTLNRDVDVVRVGPCSRHFVVKVNRKEQLLSYVHLSGFSSLEDWWQTILSFIPYEGMPKYLYKVERVTD